MCENSIWVTFGYPSASQDISKVSPTRFLINSSFALEKSGGPESNISKIGFMKKFVKVIEHETSKFSFTFDKNSKIRNCFSVHVHSQARVRSKTFMFANELENLIVV